MIAKLIRLDPLNPPHRHGPWVRAWKADGSYEPELDEDQPTTPLKLLIFRSSDWLLTEEDYPKLRKIARLLMDAGADVGPTVIDYLESRGGALKVEDLYSTNTDLRA